MTDTRPDYAHTIQTPATDFAMRGQLDQREPQWIDFWEALDLFAETRLRSAGRPKFVLHDGPPYANGDLHIGHAQNKILKDVINRSRQMQGYDAVYVPGWDCHGLPIEWKVEENYRARGQHKETIDTVAFRKECRAFAQGWVEVQTEQFRRLGVLGDWKRPYTTMSYASEAQIVREVGKFLLSGNLYRTSKPVLWSVVEKTALADAEVEYHDRKSVTIWVRFPIRKGGEGIMQDASLVIWTTTSWTIPGNRAIAYSPELDYGVYQVDAAEEGALARTGEKLILADALAESVRQAAKISQWTRLGAAPLSEQIECRHPLHAKGYDQAVPLLVGDHVTSEQGTGLVHSAPGHGLEDFELVHRKHGIAVPETIDAAGQFLDHIPLFAGLTVLDEKGKDGTALGPILRALTESGNLLAKGKITHSYPHSWRSKSPLIFRNTAQWFISMEDEKGAEGLRGKALSAINETFFVPARGRSRLYDMVENRPDWNISRQRVWGVPLPLFINKRSGEALRDPAVVERIAEAFEQEGGDAWFTSPAARFLGDSYNPEDYEQVRDVVEVWFDSGATHSFVLEARPELQFPADLYLEGSDQHRGWFHSSLLVSSGTRGQAPYKAVLTHGFALDEKGQKMSKSLGNGIAPKEIADTLGVDVLRLWVVASDYNDDVRIGPKILRQQADAYRRLRNTLRFILGNLADYDPAEAVDYEAMPPLERWLLHRLFVLDQELRAATKSYDFHSFYVTLYNFCNTELSAFYFDVRKDSLYCDAPNAPLRRAAQSVLGILFQTLTAWLAPILVFTSEEAYQSQRQSEAKRGITAGLAREKSVHLTSFFAMPDAWHQPQLDARWGRVQTLRRVVLAALEAARQDGVIGASLQAQIRIYLPAEMKAEIADLDWAALTITSSARLDDGPAPETAFRLDGVADIAVVVARAEGEKCQRCWQVKPEVAAPAYLCQRCERVQAANGWQAQPAKSSRPLHETKTAQKTATEAASKVKAL